MFGFAFHGKGVVDVCLAITASVTAGGLACKGRKRSAVLVKGSSVSRFVTSKVVAVASALAVTAGMLVFTAPAASAAAGTCTVSPSSPQEPASVTVTATPTGTFVLLDIELRLRGTKVQGSGPTFSGLTAGPYDVNCVFYDPLSGNPVPQIESASFTVAAAPKSSSVPALPTPNLTCTVDKTQVTVGETYNVTATIVNATAYASTRVTVDTRTSSGVSTTVPVTQAKAGTFITLCAGVGSGSIAGQKDVATSTTVTVTVTDKPGAAPALDASQFGAPTKVNVGELFPVTTPNVSPYSLDPTSASTASCTKAGAGTSTTQFFRAGGTAGTCTLLFTLVDPTGSLVFDSQGAPVSVAINVTVIDPGSATKPNTGAGGGSTSVPNVIIVCPAKPNINADGSLTRNWSYSTNSVPAQVQVTPVFAGTPATPTVVSAAATFTIPAATVNANRGKDVSFTLEPQNASGTAAGSSQTCPGLTIPAPGGTQLTPVRAEIVWGPVSDGSRVPGGGADYGYRQITGVNLFDSGGGTFTFAQKQVFLGVDGAPAPADFVVGSKTFWFKCDAGAPAGSSLTAGVSATLGASALPTSGDKVPSCTPPAPSLTVAKGSAPGKVVVTVSGGPAVGLQAAVNFGKKQLTVPVGSPAEVDLQCQAGGTLTATLYFAGVFKPASQLQEATTTVSAAQCGAGSASASTAGGPAVQVVGTQLSSSTGTSAPTFTPSAAGSTGTAGGSADPGVCLSANGVLYGDRGGSVGSTLTIAPNMRFQPPSQSFALVAGVLPPGMILDPATGIVFGTPIGTGRYTSTIQVSPIDSQPFTDTFTITVDDPHHAVNYPARVEAALGSPVVVNPHLQSEIGDVTFTVECGQLPSGLRLNKKTGVITGTPANDYVQGSIPLRIKVDDQNGTVHASFIIEVAEQSGVPLTYPSHPHLTVDKKVSIGASGSFPPGVTFAIPGLPKGLKVNKTTGEITGVPTTLITKPKLVTAELSDANGNLLDSETISITVRKAPVPLTVSGRKASVPVKAGTKTELVSKVHYIKGTSLSTKVSCTGCVTSVDERTGRVVVTPGPTTTKVTVTFEAKPTTAKLRRHHSSHTWRATWQVRQ